ncbi:MAG: DUF2460 domain-containing protein [Acidobacteriia bacterium]|nr:DUF2460 domain-containing protein [Terriglobia bacterium]
MATFPKLKSAAALQYPAERRVRHQNQALRFVDGTEQRYRDGRGALHRWEIPLSQLDESEMAAVEKFFEANQGAAGSFEFTDPWDGKVYPNCSLESDVVELSATGEMSGATRLTVVENRG